MKYKLVVAHRVCPALAKTATCYDDKFKMVKDTTLSLSKALAGIRVKLIVILDGCDDLYDKLFDDVFAENRIVGVDYERVSTPAIGNHATYAKQLSLLKAYSSEAEYLYFSEDDYMYSEGAFRAMMDFLTYPDVDFVSPLDHPDSYQSGRELVLKSVIRISQYCHWREIGSTCCTFMCSSKIFEKAFRSLSYYADGGSDYLMGMLLTKRGCFSLNAVLGGVVRYCFSNRRNWMCLIPALAWAKLRFRLVFSPKFRMWSPIPTLAVHLCEPSLPPFYGKVYL